MILPNDSPLIGAMIDSDRYYGLDDYDDTYEDEEYEDAYDKMRDDSLEDW